MSRTSTDNDVEGTSSKFAEPASDRDADSLRQWLPEIVEQIVEGFHPVRVILLVLALAETHEQIAISIS